MYSGHWSLDLTICSAENYNDRKFFPLSFGSNSRWILLDSFLKLGLVNRSFLPFILYLVSQGESHPLTKHVKGCEWTCPKIPKRSQFSGSLMKLQKWNQYSPWTRKSFICYPFQCTLNLVKTYVELPEFFFFSVIVYYFILSSNISNCHQQFYTVKRKRDTGQWSIKVSKKFIWVMNWCIWLVLSHLSNDSINKQ